MKRHITLLLLLLLSTCVLWAQAPHTLHYQGVLKNADGSVRPDTEALLTIEVLQQEAVVYAEEHNILTNKMGYFAIYIGSGYTTTGNFSAIEWGISPTYIRTLLDGETIAETPLAAVPYALYANDVAGYDSLTQQTDAIALQVNTLTQEIDSLTTYIDSLSLSLSTVLHQIDTLSLHIDTLSLSIDTLSHNIDSLFRFYTTSQAQINNTLTHLDSLGNALENQIQQLSQQEAWCYTDHKDLFTQVGYIGYDGAEVADVNWVHTQFIPISQQWIIETYANSKTPAISFFSSDDYSSRLPSTLDSTSITLKKKSIDLATIKIPEGTQYFTVNMNIMYRDNTSLRERTPLTNDQGATSDYYYTDMSGCFAYIGAYVDYTGTRHIASKFRHTRFLPIGSDFYKIYSTSNYTQQYIAPVITYFSDTDYSAIVGYDIGQISSNNITFREILVSSESAPEGAKYFIINWVPTLGGAYVQIGASTKETLISSDKRLATLESNQSCYTASKLVTLGDSFTTNTGNNYKMWQEQLSTWIGTNWNKEETLLGTDGHVPMGYGGSWILPNDVNSFSIRCMDVRHYEPDLILVYGGQNDKIGEKYQLGTIDDAPFIPSQLIDLATDTTIKSLPQALQYICNSTTITRQSHALIHLQEPSGKKIYYLVNDTAWENADSWVIATDTITFYAAYKGMVQRLCTENPTATIYCLTLMQCDYTQHPTATPAEIKEIDAMRRRKCEVIKEIAQYYGIQVVDLWNNAGVTPYNASSLYSDWLHPNNYGYRKLAECVYRTLK